MKIGTARDNEIVLQGEGIAALHAKLHVFDNKVQLEPILGAESYVNEQLISFKAPVALGAIIRMGGHEFAVIDPSANPVNPFAKEVKREVVSQDATLFRAPAPVQGPKASGWMLQGMHKSLKNKRYPIDETVILGRSKECGLSFSYDRLSRQHAEFKLFDGVLFVKDMQSSNGMQHNGQKVLQAKLAAGDTIAFDKLEFTVIGPQSASAEPLSTPASLNETIISSAITPELMRASQKNKRSNVADMKISQHDNKVDSKKKSANSVLLVISGLVIASVIIAAAVFLL
jgi:pSer/pThr/pTyr-binding forkhead associated (FHA) protein